MINYDKLEILGRDLFTSWLEAYNKISLVPYSFIPTPIFDKCVFDGYLKSPYNTSIIEIKVRSSEYNTYILQKNKIDNIFKSTDLSTDKYYVNIIDSPSLVKYYFYDLKQVKSLIEKGEITLTQSYLPDQTSYSDKDVYYLPISYSRLYKLNKQEKILI